VAAEPGLPARTLPRRPGRRGPRARPRRPGGERLGAVDVRGRAERRPQAQERRGL